MPERTKLHAKHRVWHAPVLLIFAAAVLLFIGASIYYGTRSGPPPPVNIPLDPTK